MPAWQKGQSGNPAGKPKGTRNKLSATAKENIAAVFEEMGGVEGMLKWAKRNQTEFYKIYPRLLPLEVSGEDGGGITVVIQKFRESKDA
jgi:hypothetical protein